MEVIVKSPRQVLVDIVQRASNALILAKQALREFDSAIENNIFDSLKDAEYTLRERFEGIADSECGSYVFGKSEYLQEFMVDGELYEAKVEIEYNRHDKRWYYVDGVKYSYKKL